MVFNGKEVQLDFLIGEPIVLVMVQVGMSISGLPEGFNPHKGIKRVFDGRRKAWIGVLLRLWLLEPWSAKVGWQDPHSFLLFPLL